MMEKTFRKVDYSEYEGKYDDNIKELIAKNPNQIDLETMRANLYGYTFTRDYAEGKYPDEFCIGYWAELFDKYGFDLEEKGICMDIEDRPDDDDDAPIYDVLMPQEELLLRTIDSTGDGKSPETALCVIDVGQEYEYMQRVFPYSELEREKQSVSDGIDCITFKPNLFGVEKLYFDIRRRFDVGYP